MKKILITLAALCFILASRAAFAASFIATVDRATVPAGESVTLDLSVEGTEPKGDPDVSALDNDFTIVSRGQSSQTNIINGQVSDTTSWDIVMLPKKAGTLTIPSLSIDTESGTLHTEAITVEVGKSAPASADSDLSVDAQISKRDPYQNEPVVLTVKLVARKKIADVGAPDFKVDNAVVEPQGKPEVRDATIGGTRATVIEIRYLITPLQPGKLEIPAFAFHGKVVSSEHQNGNPFGFDIPDPFNMMQEFNNFPGLSLMKPFAVESRPITLDVRKPAAAMDPWLPLSALKLGDEWDDAQKPKVGEPLTRKLTLSAIGTTGSVLPDLEGRIDPSGNFRIYADKPDIGQSPRTDGKVSGWRQQSFTLIPQKEGKLTLPEIRVPWWDVENNKIAYATVPAKTIDVAPGEPGQQPAPPQPAPQPQGQKPTATMPAPQVPAAVPAVPHTLYIILALLCGAVAVLAGLVIHLSHKLSRQNAATMRAPSPVSANEDRISLEALMHAKTPDDIRQFLQTYAHQHWGLPVNAALKTIAQEMDRFLSGDARTAAKESCLAVDSALYAGKQIDAPAMAKRCHDALRTGQASPPALAAPKRYGTLNPS